MLKVLKDDDYGKPDILQKMRKILKEAYINFTFPEAEDREQPAKTREKAQSKKAKQPTEEDICCCCCCWQAAKPLPLKIDNSINTSCIMPTYNSCQYHHCQFPEQWAPKAVEEENATRLQENQEDQIAADEKEKTEAKEETKQKNADKLDSKQEEGVASPKEAKQVTKDFSFQEIRRQKQQFRRKQRQGETFSKGNQSGETKTGTADSTKSESGEELEELQLQNSQTDYVEEPNQTSWIGMVYSTPADAGGDESSSGDSFKCGPM